MREIKFRAWDGKALIPLFSINGQTGEVVYNGVVKEYPLMQYAGLKDKNGVEIYEGDILGVSDIYGAYTGSITWWNDRWTLAFPGPTDGTLQNQSLMTVPLPKIIGNIYENPELLKA